MLILIWLAWSRMLSMSLSAGGVENITVEKLTTYEAEPHYIIKIYDMKTLKDDPGYWTYCFLLKHGPKILYVPFL